MSFLKNILCRAFAAILTCSTGTVVAQTDKDTSAQEIKPPTDSSALSSDTDSLSINAIKQEIKQRYKDSVSAESDTIVPILVKKIQSIAELINAANRISEKGVDTVEISKKLELVEHLLSVIELNLITRNSFQNLRALKITKAILVQSETQLESWQNILFSYADELANLKVKLAEARNDRDLKKLPNDSLLRDIYFGQVAGLFVRWKMADSAINSSMLRLGVLENRVASSFLKAKDFRDKTNEKLKKYIEDLWIPEEPSLFKAKRTDYDVNFREAYTSSMDNVSNLIAYYFQLKINLLITGVIFVLALYGWLMRTFYQLKRQDRFPGEFKNNPRLMPKYPLLSVIGLVLIFIAIFDFNLPPTGNSLVWTLISIIFFIISRADGRSKKIFRPEFLVIFLVFNNLSVLMKNSLGERWIQFVLDLLTTGYAVFILRRLSRKETEYALLAKWIFYIFGIFSLGALITNSYGSFMLAKILNNGAVYAMITAIVLFLSSEKIVRILLLHDEAFRGNRFVSYLKLYARERNIRKVLRIVMVAAWLIIMIQQLNLFDNAYEWILNFLAAERKLGSHSFTFGSIFVFIGVIWFSALLSRILLIFFGSGTHNTITKKSWWGSTLLLVRLSILSVGILIAFLASGIPLDKLTIIIGALGIGIGFGLQNIVNNLVSGVILAFERPVQVGDAIEVGNRYGVIKEIGIRASKLVTVEGSEVIVPNGDMLSQHVVNWTLSSHYRRVEIIVGVSYNTELRLAEKILKQIVSAQKGVEVNPPPLILAHNFSESSIDFRILFWCHIDTWINVKSEVMINVHRAFSEHGIEIPLPQRDIHVRSAENLLHSEEKNESNEELFKH